MNIRLIIADDWPKDNLGEGFENEVEITRYVINNCNNIDNLLDSNFIIEDFIIPDDIDPEYIKNICIGKQFNICFKSHTNFYTDYYSHWIFALDENQKYVRFPSLWSSEYGR